SPETYRIYRIATRARPFLRWSLSKRLAAPSQQRANCGLLRHCVMFLLRGRPRSRTPYRDGSVTLPVRCGSNHRIAQHRADVPELASRMRNAMPPMLQIAKLKPFDTELFLRSASEGTASATYRAGEIIFSQGDVSDTVLYLRERAVQLSVF